MSKRLPYIKCNYEMVQAIRSGRKTQTRRPIQPQPVLIRTPMESGYAMDWQYQGQKLAEMGPEEFFLKCPYGQPGDRLLVIPSDPRIEIEITDVGVQRLQDITLYEMKAEGVRPEPYEGLDKNGNYYARCSYPLGFVILWNGIYLPKGLGWDEDPWVWVIDFKVVE